MGFRIRSSTLGRDSTPGARVSQASFPVEAVGPMEGRLRVLHVDGRVVIVSNCGKMLCVFVADDDATGQKVKDVLQRR